MQRQSSFKFSRCFSNIPRMIFPLVFITLLTITIISSKTSYPYIHFTSTTTTRISRDQIALPYSLHNQIYHLQTQLGVLLKELRTENPGSKSLTKFTDQVLAVAVSLDRLADNLAHLYANPPIAQNETSRVEEDLTQSEDDEDEEQLLNERRIFSSRELHNYTSPRPNRQGGKKNFLGVEAVYPSIGLSCAGAATNIDRFMTYKLYGTCPDDWAVAQKLMVSGCDPVPRRKCFSRSPPRYSKPLPINSSLWTLPADESSSAEFMVDQVLGLKPGEIRIGLDFSPTTGTFAAIMRERNITIASATLNLGAPFSEVIALRGLLPLYISIGSRLPFFDNTLDIIHSTLFLDGWIGLEVLQYVLFDWDRVLRPKGILWVDRFFCSKEDMKLYLEEFSKLGYKKLLWRVVPKTDKAGDELFFSAVLEKPLRV